MGPPLTKTKEGKEHSVRNIHLAQKMCPGFKQRSGSGAGFESLMKRVPV